MRLVPDASIDSVVTDPPYALDFMGHEWDRMTPGEFQHWCEQWAREALRVLKPGGYLLAFGGTRTFHRLAAGIEDAGFDIRDSIAWLYGSGFPKSLDVSKAIDRAAGAEREVVGVAGRTGAGRTAMNDAPGNGRARDYLQGDYFDTRPATDAARDWEGWGTALKPAFEPIVVARKPLIGTVAANVLAHGTGALNIDASRIGTTDETARVRTRNAAMPGDERSESGKGAMYAPGARFESKTHDAGRWPANVILDESQAAELDRQSGTLTSGAWDGKRNGQKTTGILGAFESGPEKPRSGDSGGASRFFYTAKAPQHERPKDGEGTGHPTVKPVSIMRWLVKLVTPPGGTVLEPFAGSGTTIEAALIEGFHVIAIEREAAYIPLCEQRMARPMQGELF